MQALQVGLLSLALYRIKYPGYRASNSNIKSDVLDWIIRACVVLPYAFIPFEDSISILTTLSLCFLPHFTWFLILHMVSDNILKIFTGLLCIYGLEQAPFNNSLLYKTAKSMIFITSLLSIFINTV
ncbi:hypothetical protein SteCoe_29616 [Stentor coeruleus]|uniref:Uncharacterized protein n=1 Tax=Stentor coeruleus TaxID=5963 RepID=A0A1R2B5G8_9CILI|nr:hypothetical protein SteCoe_29616 [Stentor coeruleus]